MEIHGSSLNLIDIDDIKKFLQDYALKSLLPYVEKQISQLSEVVSTCSHFLKKFLCLKTMNR